MIDLTGQRFGRLVAIRPTEQSAGLFLCEITLVDNSVDNKIEF